jgi:hypothetical protein
VITKGEQTIVWLAGHTGAVTDEGKSAYRREQEEIARSFDLDRLTGIQNAL